jgi:hypothetical protein
MELLFEVVSENEYGDTIVYGFSMLYEMKHIVMASRQET